MTPSNERLALYASLTLVLLAVVGVFAYTVTQDDDGADDGAVAVEGETIERDPADGEGEDGGEDGAAGGGATTTTAGDAGGLDLPEADTTQPPQEPFGVYRQGTITLAGSVPDEETAEGYIRKVGSVIGEERVTVELAVDERVSGESLTIDVDEQFRFPSGSSDFDPSFGALLDLGAAALQLWPESTLVVTGHTDSIGDEGTNLALSRARAQVVVNWMVQNGLSPERVVARGVGEAEPIAPNDTPEGREANRRIEARMEGITPE